MAKEKTIEEAMQGLDILKKLVASVMEMEKFKEEHFHGSEEDEEELTDEQIVKLNEEAQNLPFSKEFDAFTDWAFDNSIADGVSLSQAVLRFAKNHPELPLLEYIEHKSANFQKNFLMIFFQAAKHYFNRENKE